MNEETTKQDLEQETVTDTKEQAAENETKQTETKQTEPTFSKAELDKRAAAVEASAKKAERERLYKSLGVKNEAEYTALTEKLAADREAAAKNETDADKLGRLKGQHETLVGEHAALLNKIAVMEREAVIRSNGITDAKEVKFCAAGIAALCEDASDIEQFTAAAASYFAERKANDDKTAAATLPRQTAGAGTSPVVGAITPESFKKLTMTERIELKKKNPETYKKLLNS